MQSHFDGHTVGARLTGSRSTYSGNVNADGEALQDRSRHGRDFESSRRDLPFGETSGVERERTSCTGGYVTNSLLEQIRRADLYSMADDQPLVGAVNV